MPKCYEELLRKGYQPNRDFFVRTGNLKNVHRCLLVAPHAGPIEARTKDILLEVAKLGKWAYYIFEGNKLATGNYLRLHMTSTGFNEPRLLKLLPQTRFVLSFHGASRRCPSVYVGGLFAKGRETLIASLNRELPRMGLAAIDATLGKRNEEIAGLSPRNVTNRGLLRRGIQLEFAKGARAALFEFETTKGREGTKNLQLLTACIHRALCRLTGLLDE
jgi:phage replication-related protein YjqB (UPF0714/DUF867 family)